MTTADDVLSEVLVVLWCRLPAIPVGEEVPYAIGVARLQLQNALRSMNRQQRLIAKIITIDPPVDVTPNAPEEDARAVLVRAALAQLREADAEVLRLYAWEELGAAEIAAVLHTTPNAVSIRLHRAKKKLAAQIRKQKQASGHVRAMEGDGR